MRRIVLIGPPGVGKSTIVNLAREKGLNAFDIEDFHNQKKLEFSHLSGDEYKRALAEVMGRLINELVDQVEGEVAIFGAGSCGSHFPADKVEKILLLPPKDVYLERFRIRDENNPTKRKQAQKGEMIYDRFVELINSGREYSRIIDEVETSEQTLERILNG